MLAAYASSAEEEEGDVMEGVEVSTPKRPLVAVDAACAASAAKKPKLKLPSFSSSNSRADDDQLAAGPRATTVPAKSVARASSASKSTLVPPQVQLKRKNVNTEALDQWNTAATAEKLVENQ